MYSVSMRSSGVGFWSHLQNKWTAKAMSGLVDVEAYMRQPTRS